MTQKIKTLQIIHLVICLGVSLAYVFAGDIFTKEFKLPNIDTSSVLYVVVPIIGIGLSNFLFKSQLKKIDSKKKLEENLPLYQSASIIRWAILEAAAFFVLFSNPDFTLFGVVLILYLIYIRPTEEGIKNDLQCMEKW